MADAGELGKREYFSPVPTVVVDPSRRIMDFNLAFRVLAPSRPLKGIPLDALLLPPADDPSGEGGKIPRFREYACLAATRFGGGVVRVTEALIPRQPPALFLDISAPEMREPFHQALGRELRRALRWEAYAADYDRILTRLPFYREAVRRHLEALSAAGAELILDIGAGTGNVALPLAVAGRRVIAVDSSRSMLSRLAVKAAVGGVGIAVVEMEGEEIASAAIDQVDALNILLALFDMENPCRALRESLALVRPGGVAVITEPRRGFSLDSLLAEGEKALREQGLYDLLRPGWENVVAVTREIDPAAGRGLFAEEIVAILEAEGFRRPEVAESHLGSCATIVASKGP